MRKFSKILPNCGQIASNKRLNCVQIEIKKRPNNVQIAYKDVQIASKLSKRRPKIVCESFIARQKGQKSSKTVQNASKTYLEIVYVQKAFKMQPKGF